VTPAHLAHYASYHDDRGEGALLAANYAMIFAGLGQWARAAGLLKAACRADKAALPRYWLALSLLEGRRPAHVGGATLDTAARAIGAALKLKKSPLILILYTLIMWDSGRMRGPRLAEAFVEALTALGQFPQDRGEVRRLLQLAPLAKSPIMPVDAGEVASYLDRTTGQ